MSENPKAFPMVTENNGGEWGMDLLDYFAAHALAGMFTAPGQLGDEVRNRPDYAARYAYEYARAMLKERAK